jgi:hypothetical protein
MIEPIVLDAVIHQIATEIAEDDQVTQQIVLRTWLAFPVKLEQIFPLIKVRYRQAMSSKRSHDLWRVSPPAEPRRRRFNWLGS